MFKALGDVVIVAVPDTESRTSSGLYVPKENPNRGLVVSRGPDATGVAEQDEVIFLPNSLRVDVENGQRLLWLRIESVIGIVREDN